MAKWACGDLTSLVFSSVFSSFRLYVCLDVCQRDNS